MSVSFLSSFPIAMFLIAKPLKATKPVTTDVSTEKVKKKVSVRGAIAGGSPAF